MSNTICYKTKEPVYYNKGTKYESSCDTFLAYYTHKSDEEALREVEKLNAEKPAKLWNGDKVDWKKVEYFFVHKQEEMF